MGREVRRVPAEWQHPKRIGTDLYAPMFEQNLGDAIAEWKKKYAEWQINPKDDCEFWEWAGGAPDGDYYVPYTKEDCVWWQAYETVSEGTPVSPAFATAEELVDYLSTHGDFWDQRRGDGPWPRLNAENFVKRGGWLPSMIISNGEVEASRDI